MTNPRLLSCVALFGFLALTCGPTGSRAQCPEEPPLQNFTGAGTVVCPCFVQGEQAGAVLSAPAAHYPLEILRIGIGWGSQTGTNPAQLEQAIHVYAGGLPDPGSPIFTLPGPQLADGVINEYDIEPLAGEVTIASGPFTVALEFLNDNAGDPFAPTIVHDGNGCQAGKNVIYAIPGGWFDACNLGVTGDWVVYVVYRPCIPTAVGDEKFIAVSSPAYLQSPRPNPFGSSTEIEFVLDRPGYAEIAVYNVGGQRVATLAGSRYPAGAHSVTWDGLDSAGDSRPSGIYFIRLQAGDHTSVRKVLLAR